MKRWFFLAAFLLWASPSFANVTCGYCIDSTRTGGADDGSCADWSDSWDTMIGDWGAYDGDIICVSDDHSETPGVSSILGVTGEGILDPVIFICVDQSTCSGSSCEVCDQPSERAHVASSSSLTIQEKIWLYGFHFSGPGYNNFGYTDDGLTVLEQGELEVSGTNGNHKWNFCLPNGMSCVVNLIDVDLTVGGIAQGMTINGVFNWDGGTLNGDLTTFIEFSGARSTNATIRNVDFSAMDGDLVDTVGITGDVGITFSRCKLNAATALISGTIDTPATKIASYHCQSGSVVDPPYQMQEEHYQGTVSVSVANVRTGGASDGTTPYSYKFDTTTGSNVLPIYEPLCMKQGLVRWVSGGSSVKAVIHGNGISALDDDEMWVNWSLPPSGATSLGEPQSGRATPGTTAALLTKYGTPSESWTSGTAYQFKTDAFTPAEDGLVQAYPCYAGTTQAYFDGKIEIEVQ